MSQEEEEEEEEEQQQQQEQLFHLKTAMLAVKNVLSAHIEKSL